MLSAVAVAATAVEVLDVLGGHVPRRLHGLGAWATRARRPGTSVRSADGLDDAGADEQELSGSAPAARVVKSSTKSTHSAGRTGRVLGLDEHAELGRAADLLLDGAQVLDDLGVLVDPLDRVGLELESGSTTRARRRRPATARRPAAGPRPPGSAAQPHDEAAERPSLKSPALVGLRYSRMPRMASGFDDRADADGDDADGEQPAEVADHRHLGELDGGEGEHGVEGHHQQRRAEAAGRLLDRVRRLVDDHLLLDPGVHLDRVVDADAQHHRQAGDGDERQGDAEVARPGRRPR